MVVLFSWLSDFIVKLTTTTQPERGERESNQTWQFILIYPGGSPGPIFSSCSLGSILHPGGSPGPILFSLFSRLNLAVWLFTLSYPSLLVIWVQSWILVVLLVLSFSPCSLGSTLHPEVLLVLCFSLCFLGLTFHPGGSPGPIILFSWFSRFILPSRWSFWSYPSHLVL